MLRRERSEPSAPPPAPDIEVVDVIRLTILLSTGVERSWDLGKDDSYDRNIVSTTIKVGGKTIWLDTSRIVCFETETVKKNVAKYRDAI